MSDIAIKVENISKRYQIGENKKFPTLRDKLMELPNRIFKGPKKTKEFWALRDVSFEIKKGEIVGIIGRNGAGKSTLLKILARITEPTSGQVTMYGRVASMLEVGTGFNQELTGRENIYLNGAIIGMTKKEIQSKFDDIVEFSGVGKFLDTPVKHYSSGMYVRLAFAVAAHLDADILLVDEVLAVGDAEFQKKCLGKMSDLAESGRTILFVSHNLTSVENLCQKIIYLKEGHIRNYGSSSKVIAKYISDGIGNKIGNNQFIGNLKNSIIYRSIKINGHTKNININPNQDLYIEIESIATKLIPNFKNTLSIYSNSSRLVSIHDNQRGEDLIPGEYCFKYYIVANILRPGIYSASIGGHVNDMSEFIWGENIINFTISSIWSDKNPKYDIGFFNSSAFASGERIKRNAK